MKRFGLIVLALALCVTGLLPAQGQADEAAPHPLLAMLGMVPDSELVHDAGGWATIRYTDFQALYTSEGVEQMRVALAPDVLLGLVPLPGMLTRLVAGPEALRYMFSAVQEMPGLVGFAWISDVDRSLEYGQLPFLGTLLAGSFDQEAIGAALSARGFEQTTVSEVPVWHRFEDGSTDLGEREMADPFGGHLGMAARIAVMPGYLANTRHWAMMNELLATASGEHVSLADHPGYRALSEAITDRDGLLIQALFFNMTDVGVLPADALSMLTGELGTDPTENYGTLPPYALAVLADRQEGRDQVHLIGLTYTDREVAEQAAEELAQRIQTFSLPQSSGETLLEQYGATVESGVYESADTGIVTAVVEVRYPLPDERKHPDTGLFITGGLAYRAWVRAVMQRAFVPLTVLTE